MRRVVLDTAPDAIVHQVTALADLSLAEFDAGKETNRLRTEGTDALLAARAMIQASTSSASQSFASYRTAREGRWVKTEDDPLDPSPSPASARVVAAIRHVEDAVTPPVGSRSATGSSTATADDGLVDPVRNRKCPIVGDGAGVASWIHLDDAAAATVLAVEHDRPGIYNIVDDEPAPVCRWLPALADALSAGPPRRFPAGSRGCSPARSRSSWGPRRAARRTPRQSASSAGSRATRAGERFRGRLRGERPGGATQA